MKGTVGESSTYYGTIDARVQTVRIKGTRAELEMLRDLCVAVLQAGESAIVEAVRVTAKAGRGEPSGRGMRLTVEMGEERP